jgi:predicted ATP-dependent protease
LKRILNTRAKRVITAVLGEDIFLHPEKIAAKKGYEWKRFRNAGKLTIRQIAEALKKIGAIEDVEEWIKDPNVKIENDIKTVTVRAANGKTYIQKIDLKKKPKAYSENTFEMHCFIETLQDINLRSSEKSPQKNI